MTVSRQTKKAWERKLERLAEGVDTAQEDLLVGIHEARRAGLSQADIAYMVGGVSSSGVKAKEEKGAAILAERKGRKKATDG